MKKKMNKFIALFLFISIMITLFSYVGANESPSVDNSGLTVEMEAQIAAQSEALNNAITVKSTLSSRQYAGMWIDENKVLNIGYLEQDSMNFMKDENAIYHKFRYSLEELLQFMDVTLYKILDSEGIVVQTVMLDESLNAIIATFDKQLEHVVMSSKAINEFIESKILIIKFSDTPIDVTLDAVYDLKPGSGLDSGTIAFGATRNGKVGFVTAGHCYDTNENVYSNDIQPGALAGKVVYNPYTVAQYLDLTTPIYCDASFVEIKDSWLFNRWAMRATTRWSNNPLLGWDQNNLFLTQGAGCYLEGGYSHNSIYGTVISTNYNIGKDRNRILTTNYGISGDSGSTIWIGKTMDLIYQRMVVGVYNGRASIGGVTRGFATKASTVVSTLNVQNYWE
jgi:hypothetical protein